MKLNKNCLIAFTLMIFILSCSNNRFLINNSTNMYNTKNYTNLSQKQCVDVCTNISSKIVKSAYNYCKSNNFISDNIAGKVNCNNKGLDKIYLENLLMCISLECTTKIEKYEKFKKSKIYKTR